MATHSSILAWGVLWTEEPGRLQSMGSQRVGHDWVTNTFTLGLFHIVTYQLCVVIWYIHPCSWQRAPTALGISWSERRTRASSAMLMKWLWESPQIIQGWELMAWGTAYMVREPDPSGEGRGAGHWVRSVTNGWWFIELCLGNEASTEKKAELLALESIRVGEQEALRGMWWAREQGRFRALCTLQIFHWQLICSLDNNWQCEWMFLWVLWVILAN